MKNLLLIMLLTHPIVQAMSVQDSDSEEVRLSFESEEKEKVERRCGRDTPGDVRQWAKLLNCSLADNPDLTKMEGLLMQRMSSSILNGRCEALLYGALGDFKKWMPALELFQRYGADFNAVSFFKQKEANHTMLVRMLGNISWIREYSTVCAREVIEFLVSRGARIDCTKDIGESVPYLVLNPGKECPETAKVLSCDDRLERYRWFKKAMIPILSEAGRTEELAFLRNYRIDEEEMEIQSHIDAALSDVLCNDLRRVICDYAAAINRLEVQKLDS